jgi:hypothetical protein
MPRGEPIRRSRKYQLVFYVSRAYYRQDYDVCQRLQKGWYYMDEGAIYCTNRKNYRPHSTESAAIKACKLYYKEMFGF